MADPTDLLALIPLLLFLAWGLRQSKREVRTVARPDLKSNALGGDMDARTISDREGEALPPWPGPYCESCIDGTCDRAEHLGLTDADVPGGER